MANNLTMAQMRVLKLAAKLVDPESLSQEQRRTLSDAILVLNVLLANRQENVEKAQKLVTLHTQTFAEDDAVTSDVTIEKLAGVWIEEIKIEGRVKVQTIDRYLAVLNQAVLPVLGDLRVGEITVGVVDRFLKNLVKLQISQARSSKVALNQMLSIAVRHGAISTNPVRDVGRLRKPKKDVRALTLGELDRIRTAIREHEEREHSGPRLTRDFSDAVEMMTATGARIGEILALRWQDIDLRQGMLTVCGTLVYTKSRGWFRQEWPKSDAGHRTVFMPRFAVEMLLVRRPSVRENYLDAVFATRNGTWVQPDNFRRSLRRTLKGTELEWVTPHVFRKTVATFLNEQGYGKEATAQLGHSSEDITQTYYVAKPSMAPDVSDVLDRLRPSSPNG